MSSYRWKGDMAYDGLRLLESFQKFRGLAASRCGGSRWTRIRVIASRRSGDNAGKYAMLNNRVDIPSYKTADNKACMCGGETNEKNDCECG